MFVVHPGDPSPAVPVHVHVCAWCHRYGSDHDPALMNSVAEAGGGSFTFVSKLEFVSDSFSACIGAVTDVVREQWSAGGGVWCDCCQRGLRLLMALLPFRPPLPCHDQVAQKLVVHVAGVEGSRVLRVVGCPYPVLAKGGGMDVVLGEVGACAVCVFVRACVLCVCASLRT